MFKCPKCGSDKLLREWINKKKNRRSGVCGGCGKMVNLGRVEEKETSKEKNTESEEGTKIATPKPARPARRANRPATNGRTATGKAKSGKSGGQPVPVSTEGKSTGIGDFIRKYIW